MCCPHPFCAPDPDPDPTRPGSLSHGKPLRYQITTGVALTALAGGVSVIYHYLKDPVFHQNAYAALTVFVLFRSFYLMERHVRVVDAAAVNLMWAMVAWGLTVFLSGFAVWNLDNAYCGALSSWRRSVGLPWGLVAEGHGWWHLLTGIGAYYQLQYGIYLRRCLDGQQNEYKLDWPSLLSFPDVRRWAPGERALYLSAANGNDGDWAYAKKEV